MGCDALCIGAMILRCRLTRQPCLIYGRVDPGGDSPPVSPAGKPICAVEPVTLPPGLGTLSRALLVLVAGGGSGGQPPRGAVRHAGHNCRAALLPWGHIGSLRSRTPAGSA